MRYLTLAIFTTMFLLVSYLNSGTVDAYLDPGTGSMLIQSVLAFVVGALALARVYWARLKALVLRRQVKRDTLTD
jgi:hypothetical protein